MYRFIFILILISNFSHSQKKMKIPPYLKKGDTVAIVCTARKFFPEDAKPAIELLESWGLKAKLGRTIGYPTANIEVDELKLLPKKGAYIVEVYVKNKFYKGMLSIGTNPTVNGDKLTVEVYILDFNEDIYGDEITVKFRDFLHEEIKFESLEKLIERLDEDKRLTKEFEF